MDKNKKIKMFFVAVMILFLASLGLTSLMKNETIVIENQNKDADDLVQDEIFAESLTVEVDKSPLTGLACENPNQRPIAVTISGDKEARPLSGISEADLVIEMPAVTGSITRYLAFFACNKVEEIGSVRSARHDHIPLAMGFGAIIAHWGGSHFALDKLDAGIMDNINALYLENSVFYRKLSIYAPHNGFTSFERLEKYSSEKGYGLTNTFEGYKFWDEENPNQGKGRITISYPGSFKVEYEYSSDTNEYLRFKGGTREMDKNTSAQVVAKNVLVMYAASRQIEGQYNDMDIEGEGDAIIFQNGEEIKGKWSKDKNDLNSKLFFYNEDGEEIKLVPGQTWIQVVELTQDVDWTFGF